MRKNHKLTQTFLSYILMLFIGLLSLQAQAADIGTGISYQGRLDDTNAPASGSYDFQFTLYDNVTAGTQVGNTLPQTLTVTDGIFNTTLDFGAGAFNNQARFLEIDVRVSGSGGYSTLSPRQAITTVPNASSVKSVGNVVTVAKSGGDFTTIAAALASITATVSNPFLIHIGPGIYDETINLKSYIDIEGSGRGITIIRGPGGSTFSGTLNANGAIVSEVRLLSIEAVTTTESKAIGIHVVNGGTTLKFSHVTISASGGSADTYGIYNYNSSPSLSDVTLKAAGGNNARGIFNQLNSSPILLNVTVDASTGNSNAAIYNNSNSSPSLTNVIATASSGTSSFGLFNSNGANPIIKNSELSGVSNSLANDGSSSAKISFSQIDGPIASGGGASCFNSHDAASKPLNENCLPIACYGSYLVDRVLQSVNPVTGELGQPEYRFEVWSFNQDGTFLAGTSASRSTSTGLGAPGVNEMGVWSIKPDGAILITYFWLDDYVENGEIYRFDISAAFSPDCTTLGTVVESLRGYNPLTQDPLDPTDGRDYSRVGTNTFSGRLITTVPAL